MTPVSPIPLGPFDLLSPVGRGGMGEVWRARHRGQRTPVAVKILTPRGDAKEHFGALFRDEVRAVAALDHPHIVRVFDYGELPEASAEASDGRLSAGLPYLVMELSSWGSLARWQRRLRWSEVRVVLLALLDALGHAHARGVIHRDIKPGNVLLCGPMDLRPGIRLADFGIAHISQGRPQGHRFMGTPHYTAPEQLLGRTGELGPWTDLYGLGQLAIALLRGGPLIQGETLDDMPQAPAGFVPWIRRMLAEDPLQRFRRAADAAWALVSLARSAPVEAELTAHLGPSPLSLGVSGLEVVGLDATRGPAQVWVDTLVPTQGEPTYEADESIEQVLTGTTGSQGGASPWVWLVDEVASDADIATQPEVSVRERPPLPERWGDPRAPVLQVGLFGVGLGLYGLRSLQVMGRVDERDRLWGLLREASDTGTSQLAVLEGAVGNGVSRLGRWLCERAHELGAASPIVIEFSPSNLGLGALIQAIAQALGVADQSRRRWLLKRLRRQLSVLEPDHSEALHALAELLLPSTEQQRRRQDNPVHFGSLDERWVVVEWVLGLLAADRPVILWLDEAQWAAETLELVRWLLRPEAQAMPLLILIGVESGALVERPFEAAIVAELSAEPSAARFEVEPLPPEDHTALVSALLGLEEGLAARVAEQTAGSPLFAVQLVGDWVQRELLELGPSGFRLRPGVEPQLPDALRHLGHDRMEALLSERPPEDRQALELAAVLGWSVLTSEWAEVCAVAGLSLPLGLVERMVALRLARVEGAGLREGWSFAHGMLRESLELEARRGGRLGSLHQTCAMALSRLESPSGPVARIRFQARLGRHLLGAGDSARAIAQLQPAIDGNLLVGETGTAEVLLDELTRAMGERVDPAVRLMEGQVARSRGRLEEAVALLDEAIESADPTELLARALWERARVSWLQGRSKEAVGLLERVVGLSVTPLKAEILRDLANMQRRLGLPELAVALLGRALSGFERQDDALGCATVHHGLGEISKQQGDLERARAWFLKARAGFERVGVRRGLADVANSIAELDRLEGDLLRAEIGYRNALRSMQAIGSAMTIVPQCNLGLVLIEHGDFDEARQLLEEVIRVLDRRGQRVMLGNVNAYILPCYAATGDHAQFDLHLEQARTLLSEHGIFETDIARMARLAGDLAYDLEDDVRAMGAWRLAYDQLAGLGRTDDAERIVDRMEGCVADRESSVDPEV